VQKKEPIVIFITMSVPAITYAKDKKNNRRGEENGEEQ
jgi:hypothetical protein